MAIKKISRVLAADKDFNFLVGQRPFTSKQRPGKPDVFGGARNPGEPAAEGAFREFYEELGINLGGVLAHVYRHRSRDGAHTYERDYYFGMVDSFKSAMLTEHIGSVLLRPVETLNTLTFQPDRLAMARIVQFLPQEVLSVA